ncbi:MAG: glycine/betaine ABC transporter substrate-binding protein, partial [Nitrospirae bacterium]|nr:glycine/betaine ABC transporter substrate-binding protein [Nitrospirota bacterium]
MIRACFLRVTLTGAAFLGALTICVPVTSASSPEGRIVIGSKNFMESRLLAEIFSQLIEDRTTLVVDRRFGLAGTQVCFEALR